MTIEVEGGRVTVQGKKAKAGGKKKGKATDATPVEVTTPAPTEPTLEPAPSPRGKKAAPVDAASDVPASLNAITPGHDTKLPEEPPEFTLSDVASGYLAHLEASGKSQGTIASYSLELAVAMDELGKDTPVRELTAKRVTAFFESERVTRTRAGRTKSPLSIAKTIRVLRQAIAWGVERGLVEAAAVPVD